MTRPLHELSRAESSLDLPTQPRRDGELKQTWIYRQLRDRVLAGTLAAGTRLPSTRDLAARWRVSRATVALAYDQLRSEGYLVSRAGSGTFIAAVVPDTLTTARGPRRAGTSATLPGSASMSATASTSTPIAERATRATSGIRALGANEAMTPAVPMTELGRPFVARVADAALFPMDAWRKALADAVRGASAHDLTHGDAMGAASLRAEIAKYLGLSRGIACHADQVLVLSGIRHGLALCGRQLLTGRETVAVEDPSYLHAEPLLARYAKRVVRVPIDAQGLRVDALSAAGDVRLVHVTPAHQSPTGVTMPVSRRLALLRWAADGDRWIVEDDYDSEFSYDSAPLPALKSLDRADRVIHCGSFNKTMFGELRIGYAVLPDALVPSFREARHLTGRANGVIEQLALASFLASGAFARHLRRSRLVYARRRDVVIAALQRALGAGRLHVTGAQAGFHLVWWPPPGFDVARLRELADAAGLVLPWISRMTSRSDLPDGAMLGYTGLGDDAVRAHADTLAQLIERTLGESPGRARSAKRRPRA